MIFESIKKVGATEIETLKTKGLSDSEINSIAAERLIYVKLSRPKQIYLITLDLRTVKPANSQTLQLQIMDYKPDKNILLDIVGYVPKQGQTTPKSQTVRLFRYKPKDKEAMVIVKESHIPAICEDKKDEEYIKSLYDTIKEQYLNKLIVLDSSKTTDKGVIKVPIGGRAGKDKVVFLKVRHDKEHQNFNATDEFINTYLKDSYKLEKLDHDFTCQLCGSTIRAGDLMFTMPKPFTFLTADKKSYAPNMNEGEMYKFFGVCEKCGRELFVGKSVIETRLVKSNGLFGISSNMYIIPSIIPLELSSMSKISKEQIYSSIISDITDMLKRIKDIKNAGQIEKNLLSALAGLEDEYKKAIITFDIIFIKVSDSNNKIVLYMHGIPPSRIGFISNMLQEASRESGFKGKKASLHLYTFSEFLPKEKIVQFIDIIFTQKTGNMENLKKIIKKNYVNIINKMDKKGDNPRFITRDYIGAMLFLKKVLGG